MICVRWGCLTDANVLLPYAAIICIVWGYVIDAWPTTSDYYLFDTNQGTQISVSLLVKVLHSINKKKGRYGCFALKIDLERHMI